MLGTWPGAQKSRNQGNQGKLIEISRNTCYTTTQIRVRSTFFLDMALATAAWSTLLSQSYVYIVVIIGMAKTTISCLRKVCKKYANSVAYLLHICCVNFSDFLHIVCIFFAYLLHTFWRFGCWCVAYFWYTSGILLKYVCKLVWVLHTFCKLLAYCCHILSKISHMWYIVLHIFIILHTCCIFVAYVLHDFALYFMDSDG